MQDPKDTPHCLMRELASHTVRDPVTVTIVFSRTDSPIFNDLPSQVKLIKRLTRSGLNYTEPTIFVQL